MTGHWRRVGVRAGVIFICLVFALICFLSIRFVRLAGQNPRRTVSKIASWAGTGKEPGEVSGAGGLIVAGGVVVLADIGNARVQRFSLVGDYLGSWTRGAGSAPALVGPADVAEDAQGLIYVVDADTGAIHLFDSAGKPLRAFSGVELGAYRPQGIAVGKGGKILLADTGNSRIVALNASGQSEAIWGRKGAGPDELSEPMGIRTDPEGYVYVADRGNGRVKQLSPTGRTVRIWPVPGTPARVALDAKGFVYVSDSQQGKVWRLSPDSDKCERLIPPDPQDFAWVAGLAADRGRLFGVGARGLFVCEPLP